jgi:hypothetical protein
VNTPLYEAGEYAEAADRGRQLVEAHPQYAGLLYNLACCENLARRTADAVDHLGLAIEHSVSCRRDCCVFVRSGRPATRR